MSAPGGQGHRESLDELICEVSDHLQFNLDAYGKVWTGEDEDTRFICRPLLAEVERLRSALEEMTKWAEAARGHYGIEECSGPGQPRTEWDEIQDGLRAAALFAREALSGPAPNEDRG